MEWLAPVVVALPLLSAAGLAAGAHFLPARADDIVGTATAAATLALSAVLLVESSREPVAYWFGGWRPRHDVALGVVFTVEPLGSALALLACILTTATFVFSWRFFDEVGTLFHVLVLVFLAGLVGFALSGDLFNLFVFFELASVSAFALTGYGIQQRAPLQGALNFAITNTTGAILILVGIALVYGRTGALNLAQAGHALATQPADELVVVAFLLLSVGMLVKAGAVPFHFWLADAYAVAPVPVCVLFAGVMSDMGLFGFAKVYWTVFAGALGAHGEALRGIFVGLGVLTALLGATMALLERDLKRLLAFATVGHIGVFLAGIALLNPMGLAGAVLYIVADGLVRGSLFLCVGILVYRLGSADELALHGRGRVTPVAGVTFAVGSLAIAGLPPFGPFLGKSLVDDGASKAGYGWLAVVATVAAALTSAALLRAGARIFLGWGPKEDRLLPPGVVEAKGEEPEVRRISAASLLVLVPATGLLVAGLAVGFASGLAEAAHRHAVSFEDRAAYSAWVLESQLPPAVHVPHYEPAAGDLAVGGGSALAALGLAALLLWHERLPWLLGGRARLLGGSSIGFLRSLHSGRVGDYVTWLVVGTAVLGGLLTIGIR
jgi:multicomponent Na+:H+ antiporter subunit D